MEDKNYHQKKPKKVKPTEKQRRGVNAIISGHSKTLMDGMRSAGYAKATARKAKTHFVESKGVQVYLATLNEKAKKLWAMSLPDKVMDVYLEGLEAQRHVGKNAIPVPDHLTRKAFADTFSRFFKWGGEAGSGNKYAQFNFFSVSEEKRGEFNQDFKRFLKYFNANK